MYVKLFRRRECAGVFAQFCDGCDIRDVHCFETEDQIDIMAQIQRLLEARGRDPTTVPVVADCPLNGEKR